ncbi:carboxylesterase/lipase family protein [Geodermatophilus sp. TF02-6]|uniref:carboxylesterase/lipase family protein n=1 Tax=Geodermatophilus sp. TF02-6 TaxID=2250575 RepID=UPI000DE9FBFE|nr:carboxylesterase/lipase family protein [Geodermatophilus sp. TF02-6]RBY83715.1 carboxylesterase/lipase family protein [Geodermatophilus sp. TF02-6]
MAPEPLVRTTSGTVRGTIRDGVHAFLGIPYAAPPFGPRRFAAPAPPEPWDGVRPATGYGPTAPKPPYAPPYDVLLPEPQIPGEDCLNLNVWTPDPGASGLPVFVWVHGGAFVNGSGAVPVYDGATFARDGVVCVTLNYRLGVDGFLHFADDGPANRGLLDQVAALRWVQENVAAFGGDPARVTVGGESAGGMSVGCLLAMPSARGLFAQAVLQSGAGHHALSTGTATRIGGYVAERLGRPAEREALAQVPVDELVAAQQAVVADATTVPDPARWGEVTVNLMPFEPVVDGEVLPDLPIRRIAAGSARDVAVLVGANRDEQRLFLVPNGLIDLVTDQLVQMAVAGYGAPVAETLEVYGRGRPGATPGELLADVATDWFFRIPALRVAEAQAEEGAGAWVYEFSWPSPQYGGRLGACHALELGFTFDTLALEAHGALMGPAAPQALADEVHGAWVRFVRDGDPGWAPYDLDRRPVQDFGEQVRLDDDPRAEQRTLWDGVR